MTPTLRKEMVLRVRRGRSFAWLSVYVVALALATVVAYAAARKGETARVGSGWMFGQQVFALLLYVQALLSAIAAPALMCGSMASETAEGTLPLLVASPARPWEVLFGKFFPGMAFLGLLTAASLPLSGTCLVFGGVTVEDLAGAYAGLAGGMLLHGMLGLWASTLFLRTPAAAAFSYGALAACSALGWAEPALGGNAVYLLGRGLVVTALVGTVALALARPVTATVISGLSHLGCGCVLVAGILAINGCVWLVPVLDQPLLVYLNPFTGPMPFASVIGWAGMPRAIDRRDAMVAVAVDVALALLLFLASWMRLRRLMLGGARSDLRRAAPVELPC